MKTLINLIIALMITAGANAQRFAIISDFGSADSNEARVAALVRSYNPEFIITAGDNFHLTRTPLDRMVRDHYGWSFPEFYPSTGNHDITDPVDYYVTQAAYLANYRDYFNWIPSAFGRRYYTLDKGQITFAFINSDFAGQYSYCPEKNKIWEPDGIDSNSIQSNNIRMMLNRSGAKFKIAVFHHPPYFSFPYDYDTTTTVNCSGTPYRLRLRVDTLHNRLKWNFKKMGVSLVVNGHNHLAEHLKVDGLDYYLQLSGGAGLGPFFANRNPYSKFFYKSNFGFTLAEASSDSLLLRLINVNNQEIYKFAVYPQKSLRIKAKVRAGADSVTAELRAPEVPYQIVDRATRQLNTFGQAVYYFPNAEKNTPYSLRLLHRNSISVWSSLPVMVRDTIQDIDMTQKPNVYGHNLNSDGEMYSGDVNQDRIIDGTDYLQVDNDALEFRTGYAETDLNGDGVVDSGDIQVIESNVSKVIVEERR